MHYLKFTLIFASLLIFSQTTNAAEFSFNTPDGKVKLELPYRALTHHEAQNAVVLYETFTGVSSNAETDKLLILPNLMPCHALVLKNMRTGILVAYHHFFISLYYQLNFEKYFDHIKTIMEYESGDIVGLFIYFNDNSEYRQLHVDELNLEMKNIVEAFGEMNIRALWGKLPIYGHPLTEDPERILSIASGAYPTAEYCVAITQQGEVFNTCVIHENLFGHLEQHKDYGKYDKERRIDLTARALFLDDNHGGQIKFNEDARKEFEQYGFFKSGIIDNKKIKKVE